ncbi:MAG: hypothetical protein ACR2PL_16390 [Dehalococcoidia bacterium]
MNENGRIAMARYEVKSGTEPERMLNQLEWAGGELELAHGEELYRVTRIANQDSPSERARREELRKEALAIRGQQEPLGITTAELIREARGERQGD